MSAESFDRNYWQEHWRPAPHAPLPANPSQDDANPYLAEETGHLAPGTALDAGCGTGAEAIWLAGHGWRVTGADISATALATAVVRARQAQAPESLRWVETDLTTWQPRARWDLVVSSYAHSVMSQVQLYRRIARWVAPGGTLLIIGHHRDPGSEHHPQAATATVAEVAAQFTSPGWQLQTARENTRIMPGHHRDGVTLRDVVVRARRVQ